MSSMAKKPRSRWTPPPPPTPKILNLPRRPRRKLTKQQQQPNKQQQLTKLESLFDQERVFSRTVPIVMLNSPRRERVENLNGFEDEEEVEKWRFQAEILRAECNYLRMERDIALKKLELNRVHTKRTLKSAVDTLVSGKEKIHEGKSSHANGLEQEIEDLEEKLIELQRNSSVRDFEIRQCSHFDKEAVLLQRKLEKLGEEEHKETRLTVKIDNRENRFKDVECLRRKMERLSKGMLEKMEDEYGSMLLSSTSCSATASGTSSASSSSRRIEFPNLSSSLQLQTLVHLKERKSEEKRCSGKCKRIVRKIVEQVRAEMEQWTLMQEMLESVKQEMEELQSSRDFWQDRALDSEDQLQSLQSSEQEWKQKAEYCETKLGDLEKHVKELHLELGRLKSKQKKEKENDKAPRDAHKEKEKRVLICRLKENCQRGGTGNNNKNNFSNENERQKQKSCGSGNGLPKRSPLRDIQNSHSSPLWENNRGVHFPMP